MYSQTRLQIEFNNLSDEVDSLVDSIKILSDITLRDIEKIDSTHSIESYDNRRN